jgi:hypothetical protein
MRNVHARCAFDHPTRSLSNESDVTPRSSASLATIPMQFKRRSGRKEIIAPANDDSTVEPIMAVNR